MSQALREEVAALVAIYSREQRRLSKLGQCGNGRAANRNRARRRVYETVLTDLRAALENHDG